MATMKVDALTPKQIEAAVLWWAKAITKPEFHTLERGAPVSEGERLAAFSEVMATVASRPRTEEQLTAFAGALSRLLAEHNPQILAVDYGPDATLLSAATEAGIPNPHMLVFPWKTSMWFTDGKVRVSCGYRAPTEVLYDPQASVDA